MEGLVHRMGELVRQLLAPLAAGAFVGVVGWLSGFPLELIAFVAIVVAVATFVPLRIVGWANHGGHTRRS